MLSVLALLFGVSLSRRLHRETTFLISAGLPPGCLIFLTAHVLVTRNGVWFGFSLRGFIPAKTPPVRFRMRAVALVPAGKPITTAAVEMGVSATATHNWARQDQIDREEAPGITTPQTMELVKAKKRIRQTRNRRRDSEGRSEAARGGFPQPKRIHLVGLPCRVVREPRDGNARPLRVKARTLTAVRCPNQCPPGRRINSANVTGACKSRPVSQLSRSPNASPIQLETSGTEPSGDSGYARSRRNPARFVSTSTMAATTSIKRAID